MEPPSVESAAPPLFAEAPAWKSIGQGWRPLFGNYRELGFSFEWHEFTAVKEFDWARSFHPASIELCLNLSGTGRLADGRETVNLLPQTFTFYYQGQPPLTAARLAAQEHRFITIEFSPTFLQEHFRQQAGNLHPLIRAVVLGEANESSVVEPERLVTTLQQLVESMKHCPVFSPAKEMWFRCKALEIAAHLFFRPEGGDLFCTRTQRLARERVAKAQMILRERLQNPPSLEDLSRMVNCSPFYLSRLFTQEAGMTMQQYLRRIRLDRAAELLRTGRCNVTEAAMEVGYNSLSHFSSAFHEMFGCCPGLYPLKIPPQRLPPPSKKTDS
jgi:AraC-like DNA-binding protein